MLQYDPGNQARHLTDIGTQGESLFSAGLFERAISYYDEVMVFSCFRKGTSLSMLRRHDKAIECYDQAINLDPNHKEAYKEKGLSLYHLGKNEAAVSCYDKVLSLNPNDREAFQMKDVSLSYLGWIIN